MKNKILSIILGLMVALVFVNCGDDSDPLVGNWIKSTALDGVRRSGASVFVIGKNAYIVGGFNYKSYFNETWKYDSEKDTWYKMADFPGAGRKYGVAFSINGKGYYGTGVDKLANKRADFYEYTPNDNIGTWTKIDSIPGLGVVSAVGFAVGNYGYVATGNTDLETSKSMYKYDPSVGKWSQVEGVKVAKCYGASTFIIGETVYFFGGLENGAAVKDSAVLTLLPMNGNHTKN
jgi:N-acetylneuraminic acid mutarotase